MIAYFNGKYLKKDEIKISPDDRAFLFADGLYEVIRSYRGNLFRAEDHIERLNYGAEHLRLTKTDFSYLKDVALKLLKENELSGEEATVYFQVTRGAAPRSHAFPDPSTELTIYASASKFNAAPVEKKMEKGISVITVPDIRWARCDMKTTALTANVLANQMSHEKGAGEAIFIRDGVLLEGSHSNFAAVSDDTLYTAPLNNYILGGITRKFVLELCRKENIKVKESPVFVKDMDKFSEMMILGTTVEVTPVVSIDGNEVGDGKPGPLTGKIQKAFKKELESFYRD